MYRVMLVEDDEAIRYVYSRMKTWGKHDFQIVVKAGNGMHALEEIKEQPVDVIFTDIRMPFMDGITLMKEVLAKQPDILFVFISSYNEFEYAREGLRLGAVDYIVKPMGEEELEPVLLRVKNLLSQKKASGPSELFRRIIKEEQLSDPFVLKTGEFLEENIHRNPTIEELADVFGMHKDYVGKQIKQKTGLPFRVLCNKIKIEYAKPLIRNGQYKVYEVSELLGFSSPDYFTQLFKSEVKMTPAEYKKSKISDF